LIASFSKGITFVKGKLEEIIMPRDQSNKVKTCKSKA
jgi:hypothetical protein